MYAFTIEGKKNHQILTYSILDQVAPIDLFFYCQVTRQNTVHACVNQSDVVALQLRSCYMYQSYDCTISPLKDSYWNPFNLIHFEFS